MLKRYSLFISRLSCYHVIASLEKKRNTFSNNHIRILHSKTYFMWKPHRLVIIYNTIFHMNKVVFQILWTITWLLLWVFLIFSQPAVYFEKSPSQMKIDEENLFWGTAREVLFMIGTCFIEEHLTTYFWKSAYVYWVRSILYEIKEMNTFEIHFFFKGVLFYQPAELFLSFCQLGGEKEHLLQ